MWSKCSHAFHRIYSPCCLSMGLALAWKAIKTRQIIISWTYQFGSSESSFCAATIANASHTKTEHTFNGSSWLCNTGISKKSRSWRIWQRAWMARRCGIVGDVLEKQKQTCQLKGSAWQSFHHNTLHNWAILHYAQETMLENFMKMSYSRWIELSLPQSP